MAFAGLQGELGVPTKGLIDYLTNFSDETIKQLRAGTGIAIHDFDSLKAALLKAGEMTSEYHKKIEASGVKGYQAGLRLQLLIERKLGPGAGEAAQALKKFTELDPSKQAKVWANISDSIGGTGAGLNQLNKQFEQTKTAYNSIIALKDAFTSAFTASRRLIEYAIIPFVDGLTAVVKVITWVTTGIFKLADGLDSVTGYIFGAHNAFKTLFGAFTAYGGLLLVFGGGLTKIGSVLGGLLLKIPLMDKLWGGMVKSWTGSTNFLTKSVSGIGKTVTQVIADVLKPLGPVKDELLAVAGAIALAGYGAKEFADAAVEMSKASYSAYAALVLLGGGTVALAYGLAAVATSLAPALAPMIGLGVALGLAGGAAWLFADAAVKLAAGGWAAVGSMVALGAAMTGITTGFAVVATVLTPALPVMAGLAGVLVVAGGAAWLFAKAAQVGAAATKEFAEALVGIGASTEGLRAFSEVGSCRYRDRGVCVEHWVAERGAVGLDSQAAEYAG